MTLNVIAFLTLKFILWLNRTIIRWSCIVCECGAFNMENSTNSTSLLQLNTSTEAKDVVPFKIFQEYEAIIFAFILIVFAVIGLLANSITFAAIWKSPKLKNTVFNIFLLSLCVSDFLSAIDSMGVLYRRTWGFRQWDLPEFLCKLTLAVELWTTAATMQHVVIFSLLRLVSLKLPNKFKRIKPIHAKVIVIVLWIETFFIAFIPFYLFPGVKPAPKDPSKPSWYSCTMQRKWFPILTKYSSIGFPFILYAPLALVVLLSMYVMFLILQCRKNSLFRPQARTHVVKKENFALIQLGLIAFSFLLGYIPDFAFRIFSLTMRTSGHNIRTPSVWFSALLCHSILRFSECLNPFFYNFASSNMRKATRNLIYGFFPVKRRGKVGASTEDRQNTSTSNTAELPRAQQH